VHGSQEEIAVDQVASTSSHRASSHLGVRFNEFASLSQQSLDVVDNLLLADAAWARSTRLCARLWIGGSTSGLLPSESSQDGKDKEEEKQVWTDSCTSAC
jgi:hypothetical protein